MTSRRLRWFVGVATVAVFVLAGLAVSLTFWAEQQGIEKISTRIAQLAPWLFLWRLGLFAILMLYWNELSGWVTKSFSLGLENCAALVRWRWRAATGLVLMDLVLAEDLIGRIRHALI